MNFSASINLSDRICCFCKLLHAKYFMVHMPLDLFENLPCYLFDRSGISGFAGKESNTSTTVIVAVASSAGALAVVLIIAACVFLRLKKAKQKDESMFLSSNSIFNLKNSVCNLFP